MVRVLGIEVPILDIKRGNQRLRKVKDDKAGAAHLIRRPKGSVGVAQYLS
jgi:hypothetical protein